jgi:hypothetical protein
VAVGEEAVVADAVEAVRQGVQQKAADELIGVKGQDLGLAAMTIVLPAKGNAGVGYTDETGIGDGDTMGVAAQIGERRRRG